MKGRYTFWDRYGSVVGIDPTDDLEKAVKDARNFECEIYDRETEQFPYLIGEHGHYWNTDWILLMEGKVNGKREMAAMQTLH